MEECGSGVVLNNEVKAKYNFDHYYKGVTVDWTGIFLIAKESFDY